MNKQGLTYTVIFSFLVSFVFVLVLAFANTGTAPVVALNQQIARQRAILNAMGVSFSTDQEVLDRFAAVEEIERNGMVLFRTEVDGDVVFAKEFVGSGLWGQINGILAVTEDMTRTAGIEIISHNETPGLGGRIDEAWFKQQFRGERIVDNSIRVGDAGEGDEDHSNGVIDAITGASRTSDSMQTILATELSTLSDTLGGNS